MFWRLSHKRRRKDQALKVNAEELVAGWERKLSVETEKQRNLRREFTPRVDYADGKKKPVQEQE